MIFRYSFAFSKASLLLFARYKIKIDSFGFLYTVTREIVFINT